MPPSREVDYILHDCLFAVGQAVGRTSRIDYEAIVFLRVRYRQLFLRAMVENGNSWAADRRRVTAVGRYLGQRALLHSRGGAVIDLASVARAVADVEAGCRMNAEREGLCTNSSGATFSSQPPEAKVGAGA